MAKSETRKSVRRRRFNFKKHAKSRERSFHVIPDVLVAGGVALPAFYGPSPGLNDYVMGKLTGQPTAPIGDYISNTIGNAKSELPTMAGLIVGGLVVKWLGRKTGLNRVGTKKVKVL